METLASFFLACLAVGTWVNSQLASCGWAGFTAVACLQLFRERSYREVFCNFHRAHKIWIVVVLIPIVAFCSILWSLVTFKYGWHACHKYFHFWVILVAIPYFMHCPKVVAVVFKYFVWTGALYCTVRMVFYPNDAIWYFVNPDNIKIKVTIWTAVIMAFITTKILTENVNRRNLTQLIFFTVFLFGINTERTGVIASVISLVLLCWMAGIRTWKNRHATAEAKMVMAKNIIVVVGVRTAAVVFGCGLLLPLYQRLARWDLIEVSKDIVIVSKDIVSKDILRFFQQHKINDERLAQIVAEILSWKYKPMFGWGIAGWHALYHGGWWPTENNPLSTPHCHFEWLLWLLEFGICGEVLLIIWFGWCFGYFVKNRHYIFWSNFGGILQVIYLFSGCCEIVFHPIGTQSVYVLATCACIAMIERETMRSRAADTVVRR